MGRFTTVAAARREVLHTSRLQHRRQAGSLSSQLVTPHTLAYYIDSCAWFFLLLQSWQLSISKDVSAWRRTSAMELNLRGRLVIIVGPLALCSVGPNTIALSRAATSGAAGIFGAFGAILRFHVVHLALQLKRQWAWRVTCGCRTADALLSSAALDFITFFNQGSSWPFKAAIHFSF